MAKPIDNLKNRLLFALNKRNMKPIELSEKTKIPKSSISQYMSGYSKPTGERIYLISKALDINEAWLLGYDAPMEKEEKKPQIGTLYNPTVHRIPVLGYISAGLPLYADEHIIDYTYTEHNSGGEYFALVVKGDSMTAAQINDGNKIIVRVQPTVENGEIAVVRVNGDDATVKRFRRDGNIIHLIPQSYNPAHQIQTYSLKETKIDVIGKVVECKIEF